MFVRAQSKQRFGDVKEPFVNIDMIVTAEPGHEGSVNVRLANNEELTVKGEQAGKLLAYLKQSELV